MAHHVKVQPLRMRQHDPAIGCDRLRGLGYWAVCSCGWKSKVVPSVHDARGWGLVHVSETLPGKAASR